MAPPKRVAQTIGEPSSDSIPSSGKIGHPAHLRRGSMASTRVGSFKQPTETSTGRQGATTVPALTLGGILFRMTSAGELTTLLGFSGADGDDEPTDQLIQATDGLFYGTVSVRRLRPGDVVGTVFRLDAAGNLTYLCNFADSGLSGPGPLIQVGDSFYGVAGSGNNASTLFKMDFTGVATPLHYFNPNVEGYAGPRTTLVAADNHLFGTAEGGPWPPKGTIFKSAIDTDDLEVIHTFNGTDGAGPRGALVATTDQWLYGTTYQGGDHGLGTVFRMDYNGQSFTLIHSFSGVSGANSTAGLIQAADGRLYGTAGGGPFGGHGVIFRLSNAQIAVNEVAPSSGPGAAGAALTILGGGFVPGVTVTIGGKNATNVTVADSTFLHLLMPALSPGTYDVTVTAPGGAASATLPAAFVVSVAGPPTITGFSPTSGPTGTAVTINGSGFTGATAVAFNGVAATSFTVNSDTSITATVSPGATTGELSVQRRVERPSARRTSPSRICRSRASPRRRSRQHPGHHQRHRLRRSVLGEVQRHGRLFTVLSPTQLTATVASGTRTNGQDPVTTPAGRPPV